MPDVLAAIRPGEQDFALLLHLVGATITFGAFLACVTSIALARGEVRLLRIGYFSLLLVGVPGLILMRAAGQWLYNLQHWNDIGHRFGEPAWLKIGFIAADWFLPIYALALIVGWIGLRRLRDGEEGAGAGLLKGTMVLTLILAVAYAVAVWAMTGKPD